LTERRLSQWCMKSNWCFSSSEAQGAHLPSLFHISLFRLNYLSNAWHLPPRDLSPALWRLSLPATFRKGSQRRVGSSETVPEGAYGCACRTRSSVGRIPAAVSIPVSVARTRATGEATAPLSPSAVEIRRSRWRTRESGGRLRRVHGLTPERKGSAV
jgi:hypothetical protein